MFGCGVCVCGGVKGICVCGDGVCVCGGGGFVCGGRGCVYCVGGFVCDNKWKKELSVLRHDD